MDTSTTAAAPADDGSSAPRSHTFFTTPDFEAAARSAVGRAGVGTLGGPDIGLVLRTLDRIADGDATSWYRAWHDTADRLARRADEADTRGHAETSGWLYLAASDAYSRSIFFADGMEDDTLLLPAFRRGRECWDRFVAASGGRHLPLSVAYEGDAMPGYLFRPAADGEPRPTVVVTNGSDGALSALWGGIVQVGLDRGWNVYVFDGPGQQSMLFERDMPFRHDWEAVLTPVVNLLVAREDVDSEALLAYGVSQGGYWLPRALAFEHRFVAAVADGGVVDVAVTWMEKLPAALREVFASRDEARFDEYMQMGQADPQTRRIFAFRSKPYGQATPFALFTEVSRYRLDDVAHLITTPTMVVDPEDEGFFPGQPRRLYDLLTCPKTLAHYDAEDGANHHCQPMARGLSGHEMADFYADHLAAARAGGARH